MLLNSDDEATTTEPTATGDSDTATITKAPANPTTGDLNTATFDPDNTATTGAAKGNSTTTKKKEYDARSPAGSVAMIEPKTTTLALYKLGDFVTFSWNYTNLLGEPTAVDVLAVDSSASQTHTLTQNMTFEKPAQYTWDTEEYQKENGATKALRVAEYTLVIHDSDGSPTDTADAGYLAPFNQLYFGMYEPKEYQPIGEWVCTVCQSGAGGLVVSTAAGFAVTLAFSAGVTVAFL